MGDGGGGLTFWAFWWAARLGLGEGDEEEGKEETRLAMIMETGCSSYEYLLQLQELRDYVVVQ